jgi:hypothetical protein
MADSKIPLLDLQTRNQKDGVPPDAPACKNCVYALPSSPNYFCRFSPPTVLLLGI